MILYTKTRDEHINLLRQTGETKKKLQDSEKALLDVENEKQTIQAELQEIHMTKAIIHETLQQTTEETKQERDGIMMR